MEPHRAPDWTHHTASIGDLPFQHWVEAGQGEAVVLLHGFPQHAWMWRHVFPSLSQRWRVIAPDQRGMGGTSITAAGYDKATLARDLRALVQHLGLQRIHLVGYDLGGGTRASSPSPSPASRRSNTRRPASATSRACSVEPCRRAAERARHQR